MSYTRKDAQRDLLQLLGSPASTIVVGHSLHNDLRALRLDWEPVLDTALLFGYRNLPRASIGLAQLVSVLLGEAIRAVSNSPPLPPLSPLLRPAADPWLPPDCLGTLRIRVRRIHS